MAHPDGYAAGGGLPDPGLSVNPHDGALYRLLQVSSHQSKIKELRKNPDTLRRPLPHPHAVGQEEP